MTASDASADLFVSLIENKNIESSDLLTNAANARLLAGDTGEAIALYHRALRLDPSDDNARKNLSVARTRASADASIAVPTPIIESLTSWRRAIPPAVWVRIGAFAWAALWLWATVCIVRRSSPRWMTVVTPLSAVVLLASLTLLADAAIRSGNPIGVVVVNAAVGRTGPDAVVYDPSFTKPLPEGVEFTVRDHRSGWVLGELGDGRETWLLENDVRLVGN